MSPVWSIGSLSCRFALLSLIGGAPPASDEKQSVDRDRIRIFLALISKSKIGICLSTFVYFTEK
jgi:hypothetical protein